MQLPEGPEVTRLGVWLGGGCDSPCVRFCLDMGEREQDAESVDVNPAQFVAVPNRIRATRGDRDDR